MYPHISKLEDYINETCSFIGKVSRIDGKFTQFQTSTGELRVEHKILNTTTNHPIFLEGKIEKDNKGYFLKEDFCVLIKDFDIKTFEKVRSKL